MYSTTAYLYQQIVRVVLVDTSGGYFTARYDPVYAKQLTINKGVDNVVLFEFVNQDQKPVNVAGSTFVFRLIDQAGQALLLEKTMEILSAGTGRAKAVITAAETLDWVAQPASYSIERAAGNYVQAVYVDDNSSARGVAYVVDSVQPQHIPSRTLTIPRLYGSPTVFFPPDKAIYYSSEIENPEYLTTFQMQLDQYTGIIKFEAQDFYSTRWLDASPAFEYRTETSLQHFTVAGHFARLRAAFDNRQGQGATASVTVSTEGVVTGVAVDAPGTGYVSAPRVTIQGNGAGAAAAATLGAGGIVAGVTVTAGGSGYTPIDIQGSQRATVVIDGGAVTEILYR